MAIKTVQTVTVTGTPPKPGRIAWWLENSIIRTLASAWNFLCNPAKSLITIALTEFVDILEETALDSLSPILNELLTLKGLPDSVRTSLEKAKNPTGAGEFITVIIHCLVGMVGYLQGPMSATSELSRQRSNEVLLPAIPSLTDVIQMCWRNALSQTEAKNIGMKNGFSFTSFDNYEQIMRRRFSVGELATALYREEWSPEKVKSELIKQGYLPEDAETFIALMKQIPPVQDIIRMAVRDAWNESAAREFGYDEEFPQEFGEWSEKQGYSAEWAKRYWRAHWQLPSPTQAYEMLHRNEINTSQLDLLLKISDYPNFWRDKLRNIAYNVYTRVDVRRMFKLGVLSVSEVVRAYQEMGYDLEKASKLTEWTIEEYGEESKELGKSDVLGSYTDGVLTRAASLDYLVELGFSRANAEILLARADIQKEKKLEQQITENVRVMYVGGQIDDARVYSMLGVLNTPSGYVEDRLKLWRVQRERAIKRPTKADLTKFLLNGVLSLEEFKGELKGQGYSEKYIEWIILDIVASLETEE